MMLLSCSPSNVLLISFFFQVIAHMLHIIEFNMDEWKDQEKYVFLFFKKRLLVFQNYCSFFLIRIFSISGSRIAAVLILPSCALHSSSLCSTSWPQLLEDLAQTSNLDIGKMAKNRQKRPKKRHNMIFIQKTPHILHHDHSFWSNWPTHQTLIQSVRLCF